ncbi:protein of unknown function [Xenorhabdus poinarii G6]|uniref:Uncharacterized protein n=1 Tax=Xenorhabdus poinarii G6 TaxID=1354304 RepID=A0A068R0A1_9GAMM|nr:protein of unknown function [Xenorhabdus poinarii G6]
MWVRSTENLGASQTIIPADGYVVTVTLGSRDQYN